MILKYVKYDLELTLLLLLILVKILEYILLIRDLTELKSCKLYKYIKMNSCFKIVT